MCLSCGRFWSALQVLWSSIYAICGCAQLVAAIIFLILVPELQPYHNLFTALWNMIVALTAGMIVCIRTATSRRQEVLLYMAISILLVNIVNIILTEWRIYVTDMPELLKRFHNHVLIDIACFATRVAAAIVILVSFLDTQLTFCSMQTATSTSQQQPDKKLRRSHEQVSDIEYIIPRPKSSKPTTSSSSNAYSQSWVFDADNATTSNTVSNDVTYIKVVQNGATPKSKVKKSSLQNGAINDTARLIDNPVVHIEEVSDDSTSNSDRKLCHMKSFSRSASPVILSASSSQISLNLNQQNPQIYECLEKLTEPTIYRSRLNTAVSNKSEEDEEVHYQAPQSAVMLRRVESISPQTEKVQYASLMKELQRAIVCKKEPSSVTSPQSTSESATSEKTTHSSRSEGKNSDAEFSKELEAALQLIQDLESPNTIETPSDAAKSGENRPLAVWRNSDASESSEKTLSAVGSLAEITSPLAECQPELYTFKPANGKGASVVVHYPDSQSTSGYSSPTHISNNPTPNWSTTSSINGSNNDIVKPISYSIHNNAQSATVISIFTTPTTDVQLPQKTIQEEKEKLVTLVKITGDDSIQNDHNIHNSTFKPVNNNSTTMTNLNTSKKINISPIRTNSVLSTTSQLSPALWNVKSLLRKKKTNSAVPKLCPELEGAIIKSESLAYLSEIELLARHQRNKKIQREIEEKVIQQLAVPKANK